MYSSSNSTDESNYVGKSVRVSEEFFMDCEETNEDFGNVVCIVLSKAPTRINKNILDDKFDQNFGCFVIESTRTNERIICSSDHFEEV